MHREPKLSLRIIIIFNNQCQTSLVHVQSLENAQRRYMHNVTVISTYHTSDKDDTTTFGKINTR